MREARENAMAMRVAGVKEGEGGKVMAMVTRVAGKRMVTVTTRAMVTKMREASEEEGTGKGGKSDGNGKESGNGKQ